LLKKKKKKKNLYRLLQHLNYIWQLKINTSNEMTLEFLARTRVRVKMQTDNNRLHPLFTPNHYPIFAYANAVLEYTNVVNNRIRIPLIYTI
jgi:hypothetical protein